MMAEEEIDTVNDNYAEATSSDESDDVSSTYCSDEEMDCTCILSPTSTARDDVPDFGQKSGGEITFSEEDVQELQQVDFKNSSGTAVVLPRHCRTSLDTDIHQRLDFLATLRTTVVIVLPTSSTLPGVSKLRPDGALYDIIVISPGTSALILTITHTDQSGNSREYNTSLARDLTAHIRQKVLGSFKVVHRVMTKSDFSSDEAFQKKVQSLEHDALLKSVQHTVQLTHAKCRAVLSAVVSLFEGSPVEPLPESTQQEQEKRISLFKPLPDVRAKRSPRQLLNKTEVNLFRQQRSLGIMLLPTSMHDYIKARHPEILDHIHQELEGQGGWGIAQTSLLNLFQTDNIVPPSVFCDVILMKPCTSMKVLTFASFDLPGHDVYSYSDHLVCRIKEKAACGSNYFVAKKVIFLDEMTENVIITKDEIVAPGHLSCQPICDILYEKITNKLLKMILSEQKIFEEPEHEEDDSTDECDEFSSTFGYTRAPRIKCTCIWIFDGGVATLIDSKLTYEWTVEESSATCWVPETDALDEDVRQFVQLTMARDNPKINFEYDDTDNGPVLKLRTCPKG